MIRFVILFIFLPYFFVYSQSIIGEYYPVESKCKLVLKIDSKNHFIFNINKKKKEEGTVTISKEENITYLNFGIVSSIYNKDTIYIQNSGNAMNPYWHFKECSDKYLHLAKKNFTLKKEGTFRNQTKNLCDNIQMNSFNITINGKQYPILLEDSDMLHKMYNSIKVEKECFKNYLIIKCTMQNGNDYYIEDLLYEYNKEGYRQKFKYSLYSNRQGHQFYGEQGDDSSLSNIKISQNTGSILINESSNLQEVGSEVYKSYYPQLIEQYKSDVEVLNLLANSFMVKKEEVFTHEKEETLNNLAFYLYLRKSYQNSIDLLKMIIEKSPDRVVAYLNVANSYWATSKERLAKENYKKYIELMKSQKKDLTKIPKYVWERIK